MKYGKLHKILAVSICIVMLITLGACGAGNENTAKENGVASETGILQEQIPGDKNVPEDAGNEDVSEDVGNEDVSEDVGNEDMGNAEEETAQNEEVSDTKTVDGGILSVGEDSFVITQYETQEFEDGSSIIVSSAEGVEAEEENSVTVTYTQDTSFVIVNILSADGSDFSNEEATKDDLETGRHVILEGNWDKDAFLADKITIYHSYRQAENLSWE